MPFKKEEDEKKTLTLKTVIHCAILPLPRDRGVGTPRPMGLIGPPKFYHYQKKRKKPIKCVYFMTGPKKLFAFRRPCRHETKSALLII